jgi:signal transduction histidine kinase
VGRHAYDFLVPGDATSEVDVVWAKLLQGDTTSHSINANTRKDGSRITCEWFNTPLRDSAGEVTGVASMVMDVSDREATESQLRNAQKLESLGVMAGGIAHDFNSALMVILGNASLLRSVKRLPSAAVPHLELIEQAGVKAKGMIRQLLTFARTGRHNPQPTQLNAVIQDGTSLLRSSMGLNHKLDLSLADDLPTILADRSQLEQILINLCLNAKQAMVNGGTVAVATSLTELTPARAVQCLPSEASPGKYVELSVTDTGAGMAESTVARIFDPFFTTRPEGHGLGLASVMGILRHHKAVAHVESRMGKGTKISVLFPIPAGLEPAKAGIQMR